MRYVQVGGVNDGLFPVESQEVPPQIILPLHPVVDALEFVLGVGRVAAHEEKGRVFGGDQSSFVAVQVPAEIIAHLQRFPPGENGGAGVAFFVGAVPEAVIAGQVELCLLGLHFGFLQAEHVRIFRCSKIEKPLAQACAQAVYVPGDQFHRQMRPFC